MTTSRWDTGMPNPDVIAENARRARALPPEKMSRGVRLFAAASAIVWLVTVAIVFVTLPERVPTHWSSDTPDGWSSRWGALAVALVGPIILNVVFAAISRVTLRWPQGINAPNKEYWLASPQRLRHFERLVREDSSLIAASAMLLFAALSVVLGVAAQRPDGQMPQLVFAAITVLFVAAVIAVGVRAMLGGRYRGQADQA